QKQSIEASSILKSGIETKNEAFNQLIDKIEKVAIYSNHPILLMGPTGAGKSLLAKRIYQLKKSRHKISGPLVQVNCATIKSDTSTSTLFGHKKGSFTGALSDRDGLIKAAHQGILFLDEISELALQEQAMLLHALEEKTFYPLGSDQEVSSAFQIIVGSNLDLQKEVQKGRFREDLLARINLWTFSLPGLAQRKEDIEANITFELEKFALAENRRVTFNKEALQLYLSFAHSKQATWKASFRDLNSSIIRMSTFASNSRISKEIVKDEIELLLKQWKIKEKSSPLENLLSQELIEKMDLFDQLQLAPILESCKDYNSMSEAGKDLFSYSRSKKNTSNDSDRIRKYFKKFSLTWKDIQSLY
ncbi:sigma 54-interacting transcriptional regulator, partial [bacterium]|nr:sigma 54-interacting transcriptional regulator [bacterium]